MTVRISTFGLLLLLFLFLGGTKCEGTQDHNVIYLDFSPKDATSNSAKDLHKFSQLDFLPKSKIKVKFQVPLNDFAKPDVQLTEQNFDSSKPIFGLRKPLFESRRRIVGSRRPNVGSRKPIIGSRRHNVGSSKQESRLSEPKNHQYSYTNPVTGTYKFGYRMHDQYREEEKRADGITHGRYGWMDQTGRWHHTTFISDKKGYRVIPSVPTQPVNHPGSFSISHPPSPNFHPPVPGFLKYDDYQDQNINFHQFDHKPSPIGSTNHKDITEADLLDIFFNNFPLKLSELHNKKVFPAKVVKITKPNIGDGIKSLSQIRKKFDQSYEPSRIHGRPIIVEEPSQSAIGDGWWHQVGEADNYIPTYVEKEQFIPQVASHGTGIPKFSPYQHIPMGQNIVRSKPWLVPIDPNKALDYLLLSDEFNTIDGSIVRDPAFGNILDIQDSLEQSENDELRSDEIDVNNVYESSGKPFEPFNVKVYNHPKRTPLTAIRPNPLLFLNKLMQKLISPNRSLYRSSNSENKYHYH